VILIVRLVVLRAPALVASRAVPPSPSVAKAASSDATTLDASPVGRAGRTGGRSRATLDEDRDRDELRRGLMTAARLGFVAWPGFLVVDGFRLLFAPERATLAWMVGHRIAGQAIIGVTYLLARSRSSGALRLSLSEFFGFVGLSVVVSTTAIRLGGIGSMYLHGLTLMVLTRAALIPTPWRRAALVCGGCMLTFPITMVLASWFDPVIAAQLRAPDQLARFIGDYMFGLSSVLIGAFASHVIWATRRQVHEARKLGRFRLKARIGEGGMGDVWLAWDDRLRRDVALKILRAGEGHVGALARFEREAFLISQLTGPHTVRVFDFGASDDGVWYMAMEHLSGADLASVVGTGGPLDEARAIELGIQACDSLEEAHQKGIVHRDVKPENLFLTRGPEGRDLLKLLDFGIAKLSEPEGEATLTQAGWIGGTPAYMAPETCAGMDAGPRSDLYSLGASLYFLLTGSPPFTADNAQAVIAAHLREAPTPPSAKRPGLSPDVERIVLRCLAKRPEERFASAAELRAALQRALPSS
jgi:eukaryotic-like serine/threonine-protein kinase